MRWVLVYLYSSVFICGCVIGCGEKQPAPQQQTVVIYTSVDEQIARPILNEYAKAHNIQIDARYDTEATKSVGLAERLRAEKDNPQCDVWWGNEIFLTIGLANDGCLAEYASPSASDIPANFRDAKNRWTASGMRVRVIAVPAETDKSYKVESIHDLAKPELKGKIVMARPVAGTTSGHVSALYATWGDEKADAFFRALHANGIKLVGGNSVVVQGVKSGQFYAGLTDNDDVDHVGGAVAILPDQGDGQMGTLAIPCTVGLVAGRPENDAAKTLVDYLLSKDLEQKLIDAKFVKYSVRAGFGQIKTMDADYTKAAEIFPRATRRATALLEGREN
jgi:iron(III) transport system substrate-binding protein